MNVQRIFVRTRQRLGPSVRFLLERFSSLRTCFSPLLKAFIPCNTRIDEHSFHLPPGDIGVAFEILCTGTYEATTLSLFLSYLKPGMTVIDIGAHVGLFALPAARAVGNEGKVIAFEPEMQNFALLKRNVLENGYRNILCINQAIAAFSGKTRLFVSQTNSGDHRIFYQETYRRGIDVDAVSLDDYISSHPTPVHCIKMDIQGAEGAALEGMRHVLEQNPSVALFIELSPSFLLGAGTNPLTLLQSLERQGFRLSFIDDTRLSCIPLSAAELLRRCPHDSYVNFMAER